MSQCVARRAGAAVAAPEMAAASAAGSGDAYSAAASELATGAQLESKVAQVRMHGQGLSVTAQYFPSHPCSMLGLCISA